MSAINKINSLAPGRLFAVIHMFGRQKLITTGDLVMFDNHLPLECGQKLLFNKALVLGGKDFSIIGRPIVDTSLFRIEATVVEKTMTDHKCKLRHVPRNRGLKKFFYEVSPRTVLRVNDIQLKRLPEV